MKKILIALSIAVAFVVGFSLQPVYGPITPPALDDRNFGGIIGFLQTQIDEINNAGFLTAGDSFFDVFVRQTDLDFLRDRANLAEHLANDNDLDPTNELQNFGGVQIYEVSGVSVIQATQTLGSVVELRCLEGDKFLNTNPLFSLTLDPSLDTTNLRVDIFTTTAITEDDAGVVGFPRIIGYETSAQQQGALQLFDIPVTITGLCLSP